MRFPFVTVRPPNREAFTLVLDRRLELGREGGGIIIVDSRVSRRHVALEPAGEDVVLVTDLVNKMKTSMTDEEFKTLVRALAAHFENQPFDESAWARRYASG